MDQKISYPHNFDCLTYILKVLKISKHYLTKTCLTPNAKQFIEDLYYIILLVKRIGAKKQIVKKCLIFADRKIRAKAI